MRGLTLLLSLTFSAHCAEALTCVPALRPIAHSRSAISLKADSAEVRAAAIRADYEKRVAAEQKLKAKEELARQTELKRIQVTWQAERDGNSKVAAAAQAKVAREVKAAQAKVEKERKAAEAKAARELAEFVKERKALAKKREAAAAKIERERKAVAAKAAKQLAADVRKREAAAAKAERERKAAAAKAAKELAASVREREAIAAKAERDRKVAAAKGRKSAQARFAPRAAKGVVSPLNSPPRQRPAAKKPAGPVGKKPAGATSETAARAFEKLVAPFYIPPAVAKSRPDLVKEYQGSVQPSARAKVPARRRSDRKKAPPSKARGAKQTPKPSSSAQRTGVKAESPSQLFERVAGSVWIPPSREDLRAKREKL